MGLGLFVKDRCHRRCMWGCLSGFSELQTARWLLADFGLNEQLQTRMRNLPILDELERCDIGVVPTHWQKRQFPGVFQSKLQVIFDGIDPNFFQADAAIDQRAVTLEGEELDAPLQIEPHQPVLSYATRGMEPLRGFPEFCAPQPKPCVRFLSCRWWWPAAIEGPTAMTHLGMAEAGKQPCWRNWVRSLDSERLHFTGLMAYSSIDPCRNEAIFTAGFTRPL